MAYTGKRYYFRNAIEVEEYFAGKRGAPGRTREKRQKPTPEDMARINQMNREKLARRKLRAHFDTEDYFVTMTYRKEERPNSMKEAKKDWKRFIADVRREYKKRGAVLKWIRNIEVGTKGAWHIHLVVNRITDTDTILAKTWKHGVITHQLLYEKGEFKGLAAYITKTPQTDKRLKEANYSASRNLPIPEPQIKSYDKRNSFAKIRIPKGWYLDRDSVYEGINPFTGCKHRSYTLLRIDRKKQKSPHHLKTKGKQCGDFRIAGAESNALAATKK